MAREINRLTPAKVKHAKAGIHPDGGGLHLQVTVSRTSGALNKSWLFRFTLAGRSRDMGLGSLKTVGLAQARDKARACRALLDAGEDPIAARDKAKSVQQVAAARSAATFEWCATRYMAAHEAGWRNAQHRYQWNQTLQQYAYPVIGMLPVDAITTDDVMKILAGMWVTKNETASRLRGRIERVLDWAKVQGHRSPGENVARWHGHLEHLLAPRKKVRKVARQPALPWEQVAEFLDEVRQLEGCAPRALEFAVLTAARNGEVRGMVWSEVNGDVWTVPASRMKGGVEHRVPLAAQAQAILAEMAMTRLGDHVFPGEAGDGPLSEMALIEVIRRMNRDRKAVGLAPWVDPKQDNCPVTVHGMRSTFRDWVMEATDFADWLAEAALAHASGDKVEAAYKRGDALAKRRAMMAAWAAFCGEPKTLSRH